MHQINPPTIRAAHPLARLDPRVKLLAALTLLVMVLTCRGGLFPLLVAGLCIVGTLSLGVRPRLIILRFAEPCLIAFMVLLLKLFLGGHEPLFQLSFFGMVITGFRDGLLAGGEIAARIAGAVSVVALVGFATPFTELMGALAWLRVPATLLDVALFAWRYLFVLCDDAAVVYNAQKNRLGYAGYRQGFASLGTLAGSLVIKAFDNSQTITTAMVQRGYDGTMPLMCQKRFRRGEVVFSVLFLAGMGMIWRLS
jgi:cobalt/nickel transport system permease protein